MLARYSMIRGVPASALPKGIRQDTRRHTHHVLHPAPQLVDAFLVDTADEARWHAFRTGYLALLETRFAEDREPFDALAALASENDVYLGCSCPTVRNPDVRRCHTSLALAFMKEHYPDLDVRMPSAPGDGERGRASHRPSSPAPRAAAPRASTSRASGPRASASRASSSKHPGRAR